MKRSYLIIATFLLSVIFIGGVMFNRHRKRETEATKPSGVTFPLPDPTHESNTSLEQALWERRSIREYQDQALTLEEVSQLLWAAQGINRSSGKRTAPSAGALYPLQIYLLVGNVNDLSPGFYQYIPHEHELEQIYVGDQRSQLSAAALEQESVEQAPASIIITAIYERTTVKYGQRGVQYVHMEVGSAAQNVYLQAASLNLGTVFIGAFYDQEVKDLLQFNQREEPLAILPVGRK